MAVLIIVALVILILLTLLLDPVSIYIDFRPFSFEINFTLFGIYLAKEGNNKKTRKEKRDKLSPMDKIRNTLSYLRALGYLANHSDVSASDKDEYDIMLKTHSYTLLFSLLVLLFDKMKRNKRRRKNA